MSQAPRWNSPAWASTFVLICVWTTVVAVASPQALGENVPRVRHIIVTLNKSQIVRFETPIRTATLGSSTIADIQPLTNKSIYILGKKVGTTNISVFDENMQLVELLDLEIGIDTRNLQDKIRASTGNNSIRVSSSNGEVVLSGTASDAVVADRAVSIAKSMVKSGEIVNAMSVAPTQQVMLKVRFLEASRDAGRALGVNWFGTNANGSRGVSIGNGTPSIAGTTSTTTSSSGVGTGSGSVTSSSTGTGGISVIQSAGALLSSSGAAPFGVVLANLASGSTNIDVMISALETKGLARRLAEPNLVALSGDTARFLAGGEFPVPTAVSTTTGAGVTPTVEFKKFGVSLAFTPTVLNRGLINLRIAPEVSEIDPSVGVTFNGTTIPGLVTRNAQTTIELRDGQSFAIAGLLQNRNTHGIDQVPWLGSVPVLGALFRSSAYQAHETDLVIIVTPVLVHPASPTDQLATPLDQRLPANDVDFFVNGQMEIPKRYSDYVTSGGDMQGPYGYILPVEKGSNQPVYKGGVAK